MLEIINTALLALILAFLIVVVSAMRRGRIIIPSRLARRYYDPADPDENEDDDPLYEQARAIVIEAQKASASLIQRRLKIGYARSARLLDLLEERGVIGPSSETKPQKVLERADEPR